MGFELKIRESGDTRLRKGKGVLGQSVWVSSEFGMPGLSGLGAEFLALLKAREGWAQCGRSHEVGTG